MTQRSTFEAGTGGLKASGAEPNYSARIEGRLLCSDLHLIWIDRSSWGLPNWRRDCDVTYPCSRPSATKRLREPARTTSDIAAKVDANLNS